MPKRPPKKIAKRKRVSPRRSDLAQHLLRQLAADHRISAGQKIGVAVSGGADSVALLRLMLEVREELGIVLSVLHLNHKLRGKASAGDEKFVAKLVAQHGLPFHVAHEDIARKAKELRANLEDTARRRRYAFFERLASEGQLDRVAVAHTADDQAETVLSHILRGTGIAGLGAIHPEAGVVFRPLLKTRRAALREYLRSARQPWREDATNRDVTRTRARIRHKLIPFLEKQFQPAVVEHLCQLADLAREDDAWLDGAAELRAMTAAKKEKDGWRVPVGELQGARDDEKSAALKASAAKLGEAMAKRMIRVLVRRVKVRAGQLSAVHVEAVSRLAQSADSGKSVHLPGGVEVRRERDSLCFRPRGNLSEWQNARGSRAGAARRRTEGFALQQPEAFAYPVDLGSGKAELRAVEHSWALRFEVIDWPSEGRETKDTGAVLDRDKLCLPLVVRNWRPGDAVQPLGHQKRHKLSRLLNEVGVSRWEKACWPVLTCGGRIAWCRGLPAATEFAVRRSSRRGVVITEFTLA